MRLCACLAAFWMKIVVQSCRSVHLLSALLTAEAIALVVTAPIDLPIRYPEHCNAYH